MRPTISRVVWSSPSTGDPPTVKSLIIAPVSGVYDRSAASPVLTIRLCEPCEPCSPLTLPLSLLCPLAKPYATFINVFRLAAVLLSSKAIGRSAETRTDTLTRNGGCIPRVDDTVCAPFVGTAPKGHDEAEPYRFSLTTRSKHVKDKARHAKDFH